MLDAGREPHPNEDSVKHQSDTAQLSKPSFIKRFLRMLVKSPDSKDANMAAVKGNQYRATSIFILSIILFLKSIPLSYVILVQAAPDYMFEKYPELADLFKDPDDMVLKNLSALLQITFSTIIVVCLLLAYCLKARYA